MSSLINKVFLQTRNPFKEFQRYTSGKINIQRPRKPHYERARVIAVTQPIFKEEPKTKNCFNEKNLKQKPHNPYNDIIAREVLNWFNHSQMIGIFHLNSITQDELFKVRVALHRQNMHLKAYGKAIFKLALTDTKYEACMPLFESNNCIVFSTEQKIKDLLKITKKCSQMILIGGIAENRLLNRNEFMNIATMPSLQILQAQLVGVLQSVAGQIVNNLEAHQKELVNALDFYAKSDNSSSNTSKSEEKVDSNETK